MVDLNDNQIKFCEWYLLNSNAAEAYRMAYGTDSKHCKTLGNRLLKNPKIQSYLKAKMNQKSEAIAKEDELLMYLTEIARNGNNKVGDRLKAIELLGKKWGMNIPDKKEEIVEIEFTQNEVEMDED
ncbi:MAG: terminase small subunit [Lactobacillus sp.]|nr:terminase small subunit [Lactobacillus sp.]